MGATGTIRVILVEDHIAFRQHDPGCPAWPRARSHSDPRAGTCCSLLSLGKGIALRHFSREVLALGWYFPPLHYSHDP